MRWFLDVWYLFGCRSNHPVPLDRDPAAISHLQEFSFRVRICNVHRLRPRCVLLRVCFDKHEKHSIRIDGSDSKWPDHLGVENAPYWRDRVQQNDSILLLADLIETLSKIRAEKRTSQTPSTSSQLAKRPRIASPEIVSSQQPWTSSKYFDDKYTDWRCSTTTTTVWKRLKSASNPPPWEVTTSPKLVPNRGT
ncbi:uncharacterized protein LOC119769816 [Culex quinquefasciatus]|uniref:uncharacterized protein LOC119769816 n=1 Tax=Culex quinquefasciatus TaxID=7176 RepID=UPI0018E2CCA4|nr:uncharacterized protein LOC119769816 [Culex quinquefasciatus]